MKTPSLGVLVVEAEQLLSSNESELLSLLTRIEQADPQLVDRTLATFGDHAKAARWLTTAQKQLHGVSPLKAAAAGNKDAVIAILGRIDDGTFS